MKLSIPLLLLAQLILTTPVLAAEGHTQSMAKITIDSDSYSPEQLTSTCIITLNGKNQKNEPILVKMNHLMEGQNYASYMQTEFTREIEIGKKSTVIHVSASPMWFDTAVGKLVHVKYWITFSGDATGMNGDTRFSDYADITLYSGGNPVQKAAAHISCENSNPALIIPNDAGAHYTSNIF